MKKDRREEHRKYYAANRDAILARTAAYRKTRAAKMKQCREAWRRANPGKIREGAYRRAGYPKPKRPMPQACECCGAKQTRALHLDHCHKTGKFRGWLCFSCNTGLGKLGDSTTGLKRALAYLRRAA
ncbi:MAG: hypothetical protein KGL39_07180 [Patescibacteria group bacterium]|nr:hypothetical protein [Patescibacteria group bacterium]